MKPGFPNLFIIGAMKAGTSSLHEYLHQHPQIFMSRFKEPQYFAPRRLPLGLSWGMDMPYPSPGIDWYLNLFADAGEAAFAGESTTDYTKRPDIESCAERIHEFNPDARLIYLMRDPIERTLSHYWHEVAGLRETRPALQAIQQDPQYTSYSHYAYQLQPYLDLFGREKIFLLTLEELQESPAAIFRRLFQWLGVDENFLPNTTRQHNQGALHPMKLRRGMGWTIPIRQHWRWRRLLRMIPLPIRRATNAVLLKSVDRRHQNMETVIDYLRGVQLSQVHELSDVLGRWPSEWTTLFPKSEQPLSIATSVTFATEADSQQCS